MNDTEHNDINIILDKVAEVVCDKCGRKIDVTALESFSIVDCPECGCKQTVPARLGHFLLLDLIGTGGMGSVYRAWDETLARTVAIKVMLRSLGEDKELVETFKREAQAAAQLNHPNVAQIYRVDQEKGQPYIVMELVSGQRFDEMVRGEEPLNELLVLRIGLEIAEGLKAADEIGLMHGDIKPENILLNEQMSAKLVDFGLASFEHQVQAGGIWGTPYYIAPEKVRHQKVDARSDIYSLGATLYHAIAGRPPFEGETPIEVLKARLKTDPKELHLVRLYVSKYVKNIISRMMMREPAGRYRGYVPLINEMRKALEILRERADGSKQTKATITPKTVPPSTAGMPRTTDKIPRIVSPPSGPISTAVNWQDLRKKMATTPVPKKVTPSAAVGPRTTDKIAEGMPPVPPVKTAASGEQPAEPLPGKKALKALIWFALVILLVFAGVRAHLNSKQEKENQVAQTDNKALALVYERKNAERTFKKILLAIDTIPAAADRTRIFADEAVRTLSALREKPAPTPTTPRAPAAAADSERSIWKYLDDGSDQGTAWREHGFDDGMWSSGRPQFGYGDGDEATIVGFGPDPNNKYITTYFRKTFTLTDADIVNKLTLQLVRDDGAVIYLNSTEILRSNMPDGPIDYQMLSTSVIGGLDESKISEYDISVSELVDGVNVLAVEIHQRGGNSSDISFDAILIVYTKEDIEAGRAEQDLKDLVDRVEGLTSEITAAAMIAAEKVKDAEKLAVAALSIKNEAVNAAVASAVAGKLKELSDYLASARNIEQEAKEALQKAEELAAKIDAIKKKISPTDSPVHPGPVGK